MLFFAVIVINILIVLGFSALINFFLHIPTPYCVLYAVFGYTILLLLYAIWVLHNVKKGL